MVNFHISIHQLTYLKKPVFSEPQERGQFTMPNFKKMRRASRLQFQRNRFFLMWAEQAYLRFQDEYF